LYYIQICIILYYKEDKEDGGDSVAADQDLRTKNPPVDFLCFTQKTAGFGGEPPWKSGIRL
jgi:hypothetical protein